MADAGSSASVDPAELQKQVDDQALLVRRLKDAKAAKAEITVAVELLKTLKARLAEVAPKVTEPAADAFNRASLEDLLARRFFFARSFEIYGGVAGLFDYGPTGCAIKANLLAEWRKHFILEENMLEIDCTALTPEPVLKASGHVERFCDIMVKDTKTGDCLRADHLLEDVMDKIIADAKTSSDIKDRCQKIRAQADSYSPTELDALFTEFKVTAPGTGNALSAAVEFNMMFPTSIGPTGLVKGFLRPETAQGIFINFKRLYEFANRKLPFAVAQIGNSFRNEIAPRAGLLRVREFTMAEIEHFVDPENKTHPKFKFVEHLGLNLLSRDRQLTNEKPVVTTVGEAVKTGLIANETLGFYIARIHLFMLKIGVDPARIRFRQHLKNEMAHYATDCWDCELHSSYGWIECVGCADRSCYDLNAHSQATNTPLIAYEALATPQLEESVEVLFDKPLLGKVFKKDAQLIYDYFVALSVDQVKAAQAQLATGVLQIVAGEKTFDLTSEMIKGFNPVQKKIFERKLTPSVIEPSFGIGRIIYCLLEHNYRVREGDEQRGWLALPPVITPVKCSVLPLSSKPEYDIYLHELATNLINAGVSYKIDDSTASIGRRYARTDEIAVPFGLTVDTQTLVDQTATLRERNSMQQIRAPLAELPHLVADLCSGRKQWPDVVAQFGLVPPVKDDK
eukprot:m.378960 g.378960  ORF g.378960 m.378960 type:complete len:681 (-) comp56209_c0_seq4:1479-3521(-)